MAAPIHAIATLAAIESALERDQGAAYRTLLRETMPKAEDAYRAEDDPFRSHLGASLLGRTCSRELWYSFHWSLARRFEGWLIRLFNRGHLEEARFIALLQMIGCQVWSHTENGQQYRISDHRGHFGGGLDAVLLGVPDIPGEPILGEFKTHNDKSWQKLSDGGVRVAKFEHYVQMQMYMGKMELRWALYLAVNKNDDHLYGELVAFDKETYDRFLERAGAIINAPEPPAKINESPGWFQCKFCDFAKVCHFGVAPAKNCRTCLYAVPGEAGEWLCTHERHCASYGDNVPLSKEEQLRGCELYQINPVFK